MVYFWTGCVDMTARWNPPVGPLALSRSLFVGGRAPVGTLPHGSGQLQGHLVRVQWLKGSAEPSAVLASLSLTAWRPFPNRTRLGMWLAEPAATMSVFVVTLAPTASRRGLSDLPYGNGRRSEGCVRPQ